MHKEQTEGCARKRESAWLVEDSVQTFSRLSSQLIPIVGLL